MPDKRDDDQMIIEGIVTTRSDDGQLNVAPMGPLTRPSLDRLTLRPFQTSTTCQNLRAHPEGVFHVIDDVRLIARGAIGQWDREPETFPAETVQGDVLRGTCQWYEFRLEESDFESERTTLHAHVTHQGALRPFVGFNRARFAVIEAAILATRLHLIPRDEINHDLQRLEVLVQKTAGPIEREAFGLIERYIEDHHE